MSHFLIFNNKNNYKINEILNICKDFEVLIYNVFNNVGNSKYNYTFIYPEYEITQADPIKGDKNKKNLGEIVSRKLQSPVFYYEDTGIAQIYSIWNKGKIDLKSSGEVYEETWEDWQLVRLELILFNGCKCRMLLYQKLNTKRRCIR